ncbi:site-2 protease family protein [Francisellaceae bacterium]|jgi:Zn-dependent protease|nr:site-2 protease family protein [Francisellaceae bacterium]
MGNFNIQLLLIYAIPVLFAITLHEVAHGFVAKLRGDHTAALLGRLSVNPLKHIDPVGTILVPLVLFFMGGFIFGWAKPVPVDWRNLKNPKKDMALVAIAGPAANLLMAIFWGIVAKISMSIMSSQPEAGQIFYYMGMAGIMVNIALMVLNLIPIPPLDGSRVVTSFLPNDMAIKYNRLERWGFFILLAFLIIPVGNANLLWYIMRPFFNLFMMLIGHSLNI